MDSLSSLLTYCYRILAKKDYSLSEITRKMNLKGYDESIVQQALIQLQELGYINDERLARNIYDSFVSNRGTIWIKQKLMQRGVPNEIITTLLSADENEQSNSGLIKKLLQKFSRQDITDPSDQKMKQKIVRFIIARGYSNAFGLYQEIQEQLRNDTTGS